MTTTNAEITHYLWLDLETTGLDPHSNLIVELAAIVTDPYLVELDALDGTIRAFGNMRLRASEYVRSMHDANGLWDDAINRPTWMTTADAEWDLLAMLDRTGATQFALAGSGVKFDKDFLAADMPRVDARLAYWVIDVGIVRRFIRDVAGLPELVAPTAHDGADPAKAHRATTDIRAHLEEGRFYRDTLQQLVRP